MASEIVKDAAVEPLPERIWISPTSLRRRKAFELSVYDAEDAETDDIEYIRADLLAAAIATERELCESDLRILSRH